jgi:Flp pilus assembly CpaF family ATPase
MDDAESIQFGNTVFITHHDREAEATVFMRAMNVDTAANFVDNTENYVVYAYGKGIKTIVTAYDDSTISSVIKAVKRRVDKNNPQLDAKLTFEQDSGQTVATIVLMKERKK